MITEIAHAKTFDGIERKERFLQSKIYKEIYSFKVTVFMCKKVRFELKIMDKVILDPKQYNLGTPIAYLVQREPNFLPYSDACLEAGGRFSDGKLWWHVDWPESIKNLTLTLFTLTR